MDKKKNPWKKLSGRQVYDNSWIAVEEHQVITPAGTKGIYGKVHFKNKAIGIIPVDDDLNTWLVGQYRYTLDEYSWEIPMGGGPLDEDIRETAKRELSEETGLEAGSLEMIMRVHTSNSATDEEGFIFLARNLTQGTSSLEETESDLVHKKLPLRDAIEMVLKGEITDSISICGLLKVKELLL